jgi:DNA polymerase V
MGIHGRQLVAELNGISCLPIEQEGRVHKSIARTRMFGADTSEPQVLEAAIASLSMSACVRLRTESLLARRAGVFLTTNRHKPGYKRSYIEVSFDAPTADTGKIVRALVDELSKTFNPASSYHRAGVMLYDLAPASQLQTDLLGFVQPDDHTASSQRMQAVDAINQRFGKSKIHYAAEDLSQAWRPRQDLRSPQYTTNWNELPEVKVM